MTVTKRTVVVVDASVLINLIHVNRLDLCGRLLTFEFVVPDHVRAEVAVPDQRLALDRAVDRGVARIASITETADTTLFSELTVRLGRGEAACLVLALRNGWSIAADEKGRFRREALARIGKDRLLGTVDIYIAALRAGLLTVEQADVDRGILAGRHFRMPFGSFRELVPDAKATGTDP
jgi:predicted nucleic acid-binding protein